MPVAGSEVINAARTAADATHRAVEENLMKATEAISQKSVKKVFASHEFLFFVILVLLSSIFSVIMIIPGLGLDVFGR